jgi:hypothetical protein
MRHVKRLQGVTLQQFRCVVDDWLRAVALSALARADLFQTEVTSLVLWVTPGCVNLAQRFNEVLVSV